MHSFPLVAWLVVAALLSGCSSPRSSPKATARRNAPEFVLADRHGKVAHLSDYRGKVLILDFWATWCGPCRVEIPWFNNLSRTYRDGSLEVLGISMDEKGWQAVDPFVEELKIAYPIVLGNERIAREYGVGPPPTTFIIDREGRIAAAFAGLVNRRAFEDDVRQILQSDARPAGPEQNR